MSMTSVSVGVFRGERGRKLLRSVGMTPSATDPGWWNLDYPVILAEGEQARVLVEGQRARPLDEGSLVPPWHFELVAE